MVIPRELKERVVPWLTRDEIILIIGSRQVGKTTLLKLILEEISAKQKAYFDLEDLGMLDICNTGPENFVNYLRISGYDIGKKIVVALDEIQYLKNPSNFLKMIHDHYPSLKLIVSGSSTLDIKKKFTDALTGRKIVFELDTLSFREFLHFRGQGAAGIKKNIGSVADTIDGRFNPSISLAERDLGPYMLEYLVWGGYPKAARVDDAELRSGILNEIYSGYVRRDIKDIARIDDIFAFNNLLKLLSTQAGNLVNINEIAATIGINALTVKKYLFLLENTFIISLLRPYYRNKRKELSKMPKLYFHDIGLRNTILSNFNAVEGRVDAGVLLENFVFTELKKRYRVNEEFFYWRTLAGAEVDFVLNLSGRIIPVEVKATRMKSPTVTRSFRNFIAAYRPSAGIVVNLSFAGQVEIDGCRVTFLPAFGV
jgi:hypothetical protein